MFISHYRFLYASVDISSVGWLVSNFKFYQHKSNIIFNVFIVSVQIEKTRDSIVPCDEHGECNRGRQGVSLQDIECKKEKEKEEKKPYARS